MVKLRPEIRKQMLALIFLILIGGNAAIVTTIDRLKHPGFDRNAIAHATAGHIHLEVRLKQVDIQYEANDYVKILPLDLKGRVQGVYIGTWTRYDL